MKIRKCKNCGRNIPKKKLAKNPDADLCGNKCRRENTKKNNYKLYGGHVCVVCGHTHIKPLAYKRGVRICKKVNCRKKYNKIVNAYLEKEEIKMARNTTIKRKCAHYRASSKECVRCYEEAGADKFYKECFLMGGK